MRLHYIQNISEYAKGRKCWVNYCTITEFSLDFEDPRNSQADHVVLPVSENPTWHVFKKNKQTEKNNNIKNPKIQKQRQQRNKTQTWKYLDKIFKIISSMITLETQRNRVLNKAFTWHLGWVIQYKGRTLDIFQEFENVQLIS